MWNGTQSVGECSSSNSLSSQQDVEDDRMIAVVLSEEYAKLDGAVARRLPKLAPVPHVPRINSYIPNLSDASLDHQRLLQRLNVYGLYEVKVSGDGNCQFRALSDQMYKSPEYHKYIRMEVVKQLKDCCALYEGYIPMKYKHYYKKMAKSGEWGDHVTLQAAADKFAAKICLLTSFRDTCFIEIMPQYQAPKRGKTGMMSTVLTPCDNFVWLITSQYMKAFMTPRLACHHTASNFTKSILLLGKKVFKCSLCAGCSGGCFFVSAGITTSIIDSGL